VKESDNTDKIIAAETKIKRLLWTEAENRFSIVFQSFPYESSLRRENASHKVTKVTLGCLPECLLLGMKASTYPVQAAAQSAASPARGDLMPITR
jgi:hypothetical protein